MTRRLGLPLFFFGASLLQQCISTPLSDDRCESAKYADKSRVFVLTDISNEPDDQMSLVRFLTYSNEWDVQGIAAVTSTWLNDTTDAATIRQVIGAYGNVTGNLNKNVPKAGVYPSGAELLGKVVSGYPVYGLAALDKPPSDAAKALVSAVDATPKPLWVTIWGGAAVLAEALQYASKTRNTSAVDQFAKKLRVYAISDQDDAGPWIRKNFPTLFYIVSLHGFSVYNQATWSGISGDVLYSFDNGGPNTSLVTNEWLGKHIRNGPLGAEYPEFACIMEGDTPSILNLIPNGLSDPEHPEWGGWGGRYELLDASGRTGVFSNAVDLVEGANGNKFISSQATIWRWREAYQFDFAARMQWTVEGNSTRINHHPIVVVNDTCGPAALELDYVVGDTVTLDLSRSWDPDGDQLSFEWFHYRDVLQHIDGRWPVVSQNVTVTPMSTKGDIVEIAPLGNLTLHMILTVKDNRAMPLTTYRRVILNPMA
ncbi:DUF1593-domain-containing protein [Saccharata proteae CBS 121410]|uniref:DUF1593-domain-containing protein n=1 Tax=Saccharata proteae CBS 121410 TaxID=1314787 RepID=A0A9P4LWU6_9PEZI|nr:DUF1593-domain-containing protein [Saccharata proteae CBS 121410]